MELPHKQTNRLRSAEKSYNFPYDTSHLASTRGIATSFSPIALLLTSWHQWPETRRIVGKARRQLGWSERRCRISDGKRRLTTRSSLISTTYNSWTNLPYSTKYLLNEKHSLSLRYLYASANNQGAFMKSLPLKNLAISLAK